MRRISVNLLREGLDLPEVTLAAILEGMSAGELERLAVTLEQEMYAAAEEIRFEYAAKLRDEVKDLRRELQALAV